MEESQDTPRTAKDIATRAIIVSSVVSCAHGDSKEDNILWLRREGLWSYVSPEELAFLTMQTEEATNHRFAWRVETLVPLLWAIRKIPSLQTLTAQCDMGPIKPAMVWPPSPARAFIDSSSLRPEDELSEQYEEVYEAHWLVRHAQLVNKAMPDNLNPKVVYERHYAFDWIVGHMAQEWDDVSTDI